MTEKTQIELYRELTDLLPARRAPDCWPNGVRCWTDVSDELVESRPDLTDVILYHWWPCSKQTVLPLEAYFEPDLSQLKALLESLGYLHCSGKQWNGVNSHYCNAYVGCISDGRFQQIVRAGPTELHAVTQAAIAAMKRKEKG